jgi:hypothetical protein
MVVVSRILDKFFKNDIFGDMVSQMNRGAGFWVKAGLPWMGWAKARW